MNIYEALNKNEFFRYCEHELALFKKTNYNESINFFEYMEFISMQTMTQEEIDQLKKQFSEPKFNFQSDYKYSAKLDGY